MSRKITPEDVLSQFKPLAEKHLQQTAAGWLKHHEETLSEFKKNISGCLKRLEKLPPDEHLLSGVWTEINAFARRLDEWIADLSYASESLSLEHVWQGWQETFEGFAGELPKKVKITIEESYWDFLPGDSLRIQYWKRFRRFGNGIRRANLSARNRFRKLFRKSALPFKKPSRTFSPVLFSQYYLQQPFGAFLLEEWGKYLQLAVKDLAGIHDVSQRFDSPFLFLEETESAWAAVSKPLIQERIKAAGTYLEQIDTMLEKSQAHLNDVQERFRQWFSDAETRCQTQWHYADSFALPQTAFNEKKLEKSREAIQKDFERSRHLWTSHFTGEKEDWQHDINLQILQFDTGLAYLESTGAIGDKTSEEVIPAFNKAKELFAASLKKFQNLSDEETSALKSAIQSEHRSLIKSLRSTILPLMMDTLIRVKLEQSLQLFLRLMKTAITALPEKQKVFKSCDRDHIPPKAETDDVPIKELVEESLWAEASKKVTENQTLMHQALEVILRNISEIDQVVEYNLGAALAILDDKKDSAAAHHEVLEGLNRATGRVEQFVRQFTEVGQRADQQLFDMSFEFAKDVQDLLDNEKLLAIKFQLARAKVKERYRAYRNRAWNAFKQALPLLLDYGKKGLSETQKHYLRVRKITGLAPVSVDLQQRLMQFLTRANRQIASLPFVYQRLFAIEPLTDERFLVGRDAEIKLMSEDFDAWQNGQYLTTAVTGEKGSGKTTLLNFVREHFSKTCPVKEIDLAKTVILEEQLIAEFQEIFSLREIRNLKELQDALQQLPAPVVCIVENIQNLFLKTVHGFDLLERFMLLVTQTHRKVYWVITCTIYSWEYLDKVLRISRYFQRVVGMGGLSREEVGEIILKRHRVTGYQLQFEVPESIESSRRFKKISAPLEQQLYLRDLFFERLQELSAGNISVAMLFWLNAIKSIEKDKLVITPQIDLDFSYIDQLPADELFTLGAILQHEMLFAEEHAEVFHQNLDQSVLQLNNLENRSLLVKKAGGYQIHPLLYRPVVQTLKRKYIIH